MGALTAEGSPTRTRPRRARAKRERTSFPQFLREVRAELRKVAWPTRPEVRSYSILVLITVVIFTAMVTVLDCHLRHRRPLALRPMSDEPTTERRRGRRDERPPRPWTTRPPTTVDRRDRGRRRDRRVDATENEADDATPAEESAPVEDEATPLEPRRAEPAVDDEVETIDEDEDEAEETPAEPSPWMRPGQWFVVHTQSGYEKKVKSNLEARIQSMNMEEKIFEVVIPMEDVVEFKGGRKQVVQRKVFPGYLLVRCDMDDASWYVVRNTPGSPASSARAASARSPPR